jgi:hypothetical protein
MENMMKKRILLVLALVATLSLVAAAQVSAGEDKPISGKIDIDLVLELCPAADAPNPAYPFMTWVGTVVIDGVTYGWADFPTNGEGFVGNFYYFEEYWTIFTLDDGEAPTVDQGCDGDRVVLAGTNTGSGTRGGPYRADGEVTDDPIAPSGRFADVALGSRMIWRGKATNFKEGGGDEFKATFHLFPPK